VYHSYSKPAELQNLALWLPLFGSVVYGSMIFFGKRVMASRRALSPRSSMLLYNAYQSLLNGFNSAWLIWAAYRAGFTLWGNKEDMSVAGYNVAFGLWLHYNNKYLEVSNNTRKTMTFFFCRYTFASSTFCCSCLCWAMLLQWLRIRMALMAGLSSLLLAAFRRGSTARLHRHLCRNAPWSMSSRPLRLKSMLQRNPSPPPLVVALGKLLLATVCLLPLPFHSDAVRGLDKAAFVRDTRRMQPRLRGTSHSGETVLSGPWPSTPSLPCCPSLSRLHRTPSLSHAGANTRGPKRGALAGPGTGP
jgi:hypothetical protein